MGVGQHALHLGVLLLEIERHPRIGAAGARGRHPGIHLAGGLPPDLRAGAVEVGPAVGQVVELVGPHGPGDFGGDAARQPHVVVGVAVGNGGHRAHLSPEAAQQANLLRRLGIGNHDQGLVAPGIAEVSQANACVAGSALHHGAAGLQQALLLRFQKNSQGRPVLDRAPGVHEFRLAEDFATRELTKAMQPDQGRLANGPHKSIGDPQSAAAHGAGLFKQLAVAGS